MVQKTTFITPISHKGGAGKTTTATNLTAAFARMGYTACLVDADPQMNASMAMLETVPDITLKDVYRGTSVLDAVYPSTFEGVDIIPSSQSLTFMTSEIDNRYGREKQLMRNLEPLSGRYDFVIMDAHPGLGVYEINVITASDKIIIPVDGFFAMNGLLPLVQAIQALNNEVDGKIEITGACVTRYDRRNTVEKNLVENLRSQLSAPIFQQTFKKPVLDTVIPENTDLLKAQTVKQSIFQFNPSSNGAIAYQHLTEELIELWEV